MSIWGSDNSNDTDIEEDLNKHGFHEENPDDKESLEDDDFASKDDNEETEEEDDEGDDEESDEESDDVVISKNKIVLAKKLLENIRDNNEKLITLFGGLISEEDEARIGTAEINEGIGEQSEVGVNTIEGVFNGENMIGPDGKEYSVPANYASKSKLVEGDFLKLTITNKGIFIYKQTKPVERRRVMAKIEKDEEGNYFALGENKKWRLLTASITYFKGASGDKAVILVSSAGDCQWAAVENVIKNGV